MALREAMRRHRRERGLSQRALLGPLNLSSHSAIVDYESGRRLPPADIVASYERYFDLSAGSLEKLRAAALAEYAVRTADKPSRARTGPRHAQQLPARTAHFAGRVEVLDRIERSLLRYTEKPEDGSPICVVRGTPGVGKTGLALHRAHANAARFPDGQLLRGWAPARRSQRTKP